jgi:SAM-dependent methyltransferase
MGRQRLGDYLLGVAGLGLVRHWLTGDSTGARMRRQELDRLTADREAGLAAVELDAPELEAGPGYAAWAASYDEVPNPLVMVEEPVVRRLLDDLPVGIALDAGCGTGRHAAYLRGRGHRVIGVDASPEMLARARAKLVGVDFHLGEITALPLAAASVDLVVCALALMHLADLGAAIGELARVVRPGGRVVVSDLHPTMLDLGGGALFEAGGGRYARVRHHLHRHGDYLAAFAAAGLCVRQCVERAWEPDQVRVLAGPLGPLAPEAFAAAFVGIPAVLVWVLERTPV